MVYQSPEPVVRELDQLGGTALVATRDLMVGIGITIVLWLYYRRFVEAFWIVQRLPEVVEVEVEVEVEAKLTEPDLACCSFFSSRRTRQCIVKPMKRQGELFTSTPIIYGLPATIKIKLILETLISWYLQAFPTEVPSQFGSHQ